MLPPMGLPYASPQPPDLGRPRPALRKKVVAGLFLPSPAPPPGIACAVVQRSLLRHCCAKVVPLTWRCKQNIPVPQLSSRRELQSLKRFGDFEFRHVERGSRSKCLGQLGNRDHLFTPRCRVNGAGYHVSRTTLAQQRRDKQRDHCTRYPGDTRNQSLKRGYLLTRYSLATHSLQVGHFTATTSILVLLLRPNRFPFEY